MRSFPVPLGRRLPPVPDDESACFVTFLVRSSDATTNGLACWASRSVSNERRWTPLTHIFNEEAGYGRVEF